MLIRLNPRKLTSFLTATALLCTVYAARGGDSAESKKVWSILAAQRSFMSYLDTHPNLRYSYTLTHEAYGLDKDPQLLESYRQSADRMKAGIGSARSDHARNSCMALTRKYERMLERNLSSYAKDKVVFYFVGKDARKDSIDLLYRDYADPGAEDPGKFTSQVWKQGEKVLELNRLQNRAYINSPEAAPRNRIENALAAGYQSVLTSRLATWAALSNEATFARLRSMVHAGKDKESIGKDALDSVLNEGPGAFTGLGNANVSMRMNGGRLLLEMGKSKSGGIYHEVVVDPSLGFLILEKREYRGGVLRDETVISNASQDKASGLFFPGRLCRTLYDKDGKITERSEYSDIKVSEIPSNGHLADLLTLQFPLGTTVYDCSVSPVIHYRLDEGGIKDGDTLPVGIEPKLVRGRGVARNDAMPKRPEHAVGAGSSGKTAPPPNTSADGGFGPFGKWGAAFLVTCPVLILALIVVAIMRFLRKRKA